LFGYLGDEFEQVLEESDFQETLTEILEAELEFFDRVWFERSVRYTDRWEAGHRGERFDTKRVTVSLSRPRNALRKKTRSKARGGRLRAAYVERETVDAAVGVG
jgi:hypothetical protein